LINESPRYSVVPLFQRFAALLQSVVLSCIFHELVPDLVHTLDFSCSGDDDTVSNVTDRFRRATTVNLHQFPPVMDDIVHALARLEFLRTLNLAAGTQVVDFPTIWWRRSGIDSHSMPLHYLEHVYHVHRHIS